MSTPKIRSRKPTGAVPWPCILLEGAEKSGKTWAMALLSASPKVGQMYWLDLGEGSADEYGAIPGARYEILVHDGTYASYLGQVRAVHAEATRAAAAGEPPVVLGIDTMTDEWESLKDWATTRAKGRASNKAKLAKDPEAEVTVGTDLWNDAGARHRRLMTLLLTFPGIVVMTARGKAVVAMDESGKPREGVKDYRVEGHKNLAYDASLWIRMSRTEPPLVIGARSVRHGVRPGVDEPKRVPADVDNLLEWAIFDALGCDPATAHVRDLTHAVGGQLLPEERGIDPEVDVWMAAWTDHVSEATDRAGLSKLWREMTAKHKAGFIDDGLRTDLEAHFKGRSEAVQRAEAAKNAGEVSAA